MNARLLLLVPFVSGCYSFTTLSRAHTIGKGHVEAFAAPEGLVVPANNGLSIRPVGEIGARVGVTDRVDLEGRLTTLGGSVATHLQLRRDPARWGWEAMLAPGVVFTSPDKLAFEVPVVFGVNVGHDSQIVIAPRIAYQLRFATTQTTSYFFAGGALGFAWRIARHFTLMPETSFLTQLYATPGFASNLANTVGIELAIGLLFDF